MKNTKTLEPLQVRELYELWGRELELELIVGEGGMGKNIRSDRVQKAGLVMVEPTIELEEGKIQILGNTEISYLRKLSPEGVGRISEILCRQDVPCFIISKGLYPPEEFKRWCEREGIPLFRSKLSSGKLISRINSFLEERLAPFISLHGVLMDILGVGVLILGESGIGKSESAMDLILRGHKFAADDIVEIRKVGTSTLIGAGPENIRYLMEIRGVGIINIKDLVGTVSVLEKREVDMVIELVEWEPDAEYDRLGLDQKSYKIMGVELPYIALPVSPGRNTATIIEVAVRTQILKMRGINSARELQSTLSGRIKAK